jgi:hypothetical protein
MEDGADSRYEHADGLVGVYREQEENSSKTLSLDLRKVSLIISCSRYPS